MSGFEKPYDTEKEIPEGLETSFNAAQDEPQPTAESKLDAWGNPVRSWEHIQKREALDEEIPSIIYAAPLNVWDRAACSPESPQSEWEYFLYFKENGELLEAMLFFFEKDILINISLAILVMPLYSYYGLIFSLIPFLSFLYFRRDALPVIRTIMAPIGFIVYIGSPVRNALLCIYAVMPYLLFFKFRKKFNLNIGTNIALSLLWIVAVRVLYIPFSVVLKMYLLLFTYILM